MFIADLLIAFVVMVIVMVALLFLFRFQGSASRIALVAIAVFLAAWVGGLWVAPFGPTVQGAYWAPFLAAGVVFALIWLAMSPWPGRRSVRPNPPDEPPYAPEGAAAAAAISGFFWLMIVAFAILIAVGYLRA